MKELQGSAHIRKGSVAKNSNILTTEEGEFSPGSKVRGKSIGGALGDLGFIPNFLSHELCDLG